MLKIVGKKDKAVSEGYPKVYIITKKVWKCVDINSYLMIF
jgi:hypothetical protein